MTRIVIGLPALISCIFLLPALGADDGELLKPRNVEGLNTDKDEYDPFVSSSGRIFYYTQAADGKSKVLETFRRQLGAPFPPGKPVVELNALADYRSPFLSMEGVFPQHLFFATNRDPLPNPNRKDERGNNYDIYFLIRQGPTSEFTTATAFIHCTAEDEMHPWLVTRGPVQGLFYSRKGKDGWHVYLSTRTGAEQWSPPVKLDLPVGFHHPTLTPDGRTMYLQGPLENNRTGLFRSTSLGGGKWSEPEPLTALNHPEGPRGDMSPSLALNGSILFFASDRPGGKGGLDLWYISVKELEKQ